MPNKLEPLSLSVRPDGEVDVFLRPDFDYTDLAELRRVAGIVESARQPLSRVA